MIMMNDVLVRMMISRLMAEILLSIAGWGVVPIMAPLPSQGGSMCVCERERD